MRREYWFYQHSERKMLLGVDADRHHIYREPFKVLRLYFVLKLFFPLCQVSVERTRNGFHVKAVGEEIEKIPIAKRVEIREKLGDDALRVEGEYLKLELGLEHWVDTLFCAKTHEDKVKTQNEEINPLALPYVSKVPPSKF